MIIFLLILAIVVPVGVFFIGTQSKKRFKSLLSVNVITFFGLLILGAIFMISPAAASDVEAVAVGSNSSGLGYIAAALATGFSCIGAGIAVASAASAALGALSENEAIMGKAMIFVALAEGVAIYGLIISIMILGQL
ncbi:MAG: ATP synthase subunit C [Clostridiales bacterium]|jgi:V/A-type H+-transporting ATPase subunit K|nr:ATP synthase subunit C [Clostridiales bacterium]